MDIIQELYTLMPVYIASVKKVPSQQEKFEKKTTDRKWWNHLAEERLSFQRGSCTKHNILSLLPLL